MKITLKSKTGKGKNILRKFGTEWIVIKEGSPICHNTSPSFLLESLCGEDLRWVKKEEDRDFVCQELK